MLVLCEGIDRFNPTGEFQTDTFFRYTLLFEQEKRSIPKPPKICEIVRESPLQILKLHGSVSSTRAFDHFSPPSIILQSFSRHGACAPEPENP